MSMVHSRTSYPRVSCIVPTQGRRLFLLQAIKYFQRQDYPNREMIILDDGNDVLSDLTNSDPRIRYLRPSHRLTIGAKRNLACAEASGEIIVHWDDDDWMAPGRISYQVRELIKQQADICGLREIIYFDPELQRAWCYVYPMFCRSWVAGGSLCYTKTFWRSNVFEDTNQDEDVRFLWTKTPKKIATLFNIEFYIALIHQGNTSVKRTNSKCWHEISKQKIRNVMGGDWSFYSSYHKRSDSKSICMEEIQE